ncbi:glutathione S-transferase [Wenzhouxiangella sp. XN24]|uniref:glutathione S-transferase family protein n=1 Tax=Wenzhouxiangella sp. XN24 TaxID=2713569 RepID=UPI0013E9B8AC|nr:glutathione S-transferase [Wenzhouxiangella sp. XN24]NGX15945.1 glutathione S-transferase [Wenzhouxiangella sp. XN24]
MIIVHHLENSRSQRILWLLEELGVQYRVKRYARDPETKLAPATLRKVHPLGKSPVITDGDVTVAESGAIIEYLVDMHGPDSGLRPSHGTEEGRQYTYWLHYAEGSAMPPLLLSLIFRKMPDAPMPFFVRPVVRGIADKVQQSFVKPQLALHLDFMEAELGQRTWFTGEAFTAADIQMSFPLEAAAAGGLLGAERPKLQDFVERIAERPAYQRALKKGGPYTLGF